MSVHLLLNDLTCLTIVRENKNTVNLVNKDSKFADFVKFHPHTYTRTQQFLPPLWAAINFEKLKSNLCK